MTPQRWQQIEAVYHAALAREPGVRPEYLSGVCGSDHELRREVESLLAHGERAEDFLSAPAVEGGGRRAGPTLEPGSRIGDYRILSALGAGGMGEVYRAQDPQLGREVAIKILPPQWFGDAARRARFEREARLLASLNHPHIGAIYGLVEQDSVRGLVLELVEGETLAARLVSGPLPLAVTIEIAAQVADALDASHGKGIIHRDLKPANIIVRGEWPSSAGPGRRSAAGDQPRPARPPDVTVKVLDFGLARVGEPAQGGGATASLSGTHEGAVLGTPAYMSPEQARGKPVDKRTDIWAFGCLLYEMLTGRRAFAGDTVSDTIAAILEHDPDWTALPEVTPPPLRRLLRRCLEKDPSRRLRDVGDARAELDEVTGTQSETPAHIGVNHPARGKNLQKTRPGAIWLTIAAVASAIALAFMVWRWPTARSGEPHPEPTRLTFDAGLQTDPALSPDGRFVAYSSNRSGQFDIWVQPIGEGEPIPVTKDSAHDWQPHWSPDGGRLVFRSERPGGGLMVVPAFGGAQERVSESGYRPRWSPDGSRILFVPNEGFGPLNGVFTVGLDGAPPQSHPLTDLQGIDKGGAWGWGPDGRVMFLAAQGAPRYTPRLSTVDLARNLVARSQVDARVQQRFEELGLGIPQETLAWSHDHSAIYFVGISKGLRSLWRIDIDPRTLRITGGPRRLTTTTEANTYPSISKDGGRIAFGAAVTNAGLWSYPLDDSGTTVAGAPQALTAPEMQVYGADLSSDGTKLLYGISRPGSAQRSELRERLMSTGAERTLTLYDVARGEMKEPWRLDPHGRRFAYRYIAANMPASEGESRAVSSVQSMKIFDTESGDDVQLTSPAPYVDFPTGWSPDGAFVISSGYRYKDAAGRPADGIGLATIALVPVAAAPTAETKVKIITSSADDGLWQPSMSPDSRWVCFLAVHRASGGRQIVVVPAAGGDWRPITPRESWNDKPRWSFDGRVLYFVSGRGGLNNVWAVRFDPDTGEKRGEPFQVTHFDGPGELMERNLRAAEIGVGPGRLVVPITRPTGHIWMLDRFHP